MLVVVPPERPLADAHLRFTSLGGGGTPRVGGGGCGRVRLFSRNGTVFGRSPQSRWHSGKIAPTLARQLVLFIPSVAQLAGLGMDAR